MKRQKLKLVIKESKDKKSSNIKCHISAHKDFLVKSLVHAMKNDNNLCNIVMQSAKIVAMDGVVESMAKELNKKQEDGARG